MSDSSSDERRELGDAWKRPITFNQKLCVNCKCGTFFGVEVIPEGDYDFCIQWVCDNCGQVVDETKGYDCQFDDPTLDKSDDVD